MSQKISDALGIRYCGVQFGQYALYNDDHGCGGSTKDGYAFVMIPRHQTIVDKVTQVQS